MGRPTISIVARVRRFVARRFTSLTQPVLPPDEQRRFSAGHSGGGSGRSSP